MSLPPNASDKEVANIQSTPLVVFYERPEEIISHIDDFKREIEEDETFIVISRSSSIIGNANRFNAGNPLAIDENPFKGNDAEALSALHAKSDYDQANYRAAIYRAESLHLSRCRVYNEDDYLIQQGLSRKDWLSIVEEDLSLLPSTNLTLSEWAQEAAEYIKESVIFHGINFTPKMRGKLDYGGTKAADFFISQQAEDAKREVATVHSVKGKTTDHVFLVMNGDQTERMIKVLSGQAVQDTEEKRIFYVAISRARKSLTFCVPKQYETELQKLEKILRIN